MVQIQTQNDLEEQYQRCKELREKVKDLLSEKTLIKTISTKLETKDSFNEKSTLFAELLHIILYKLCKENDFKDLSLNIHQIKHLSVLEAIDKNPCSNTEQKVKTNIGKPSKQAKKQTPSKTKILNSYKFLLDVLTVLKTLKEDECYLNYYYQVKAEQREKSKRRYELILSYSLEEVENLQKSIFKEYQSENLGKQEGEIYMVNIINEKQRPEQLYHIFTAESLAEYTAENLDPFLEIYSFELEEVITEALNTNFFFVETYEVLHFMEEQEDGYYPVNLFVFKTASQQVHIFAAQYERDEDVVTFESVSSVSRLEFFDTIQEIMGQLKMDFLDEEAFKSLESLINRI